MELASVRWRGGSRALLPFTVIAAAVAVGQLPAASPAAAQITPPRAATASPASTPQGNRPVVVRGNQRIASDTIRAYLGLRPGQTVTATDLNEGVRRLFNTGLFRDVRVIPDGGRLIVQVVENPSINKIAFEGNDELSDEVLEPVIELRARLPLTVAAAEADAERIKDVYRSAGYYGAEVDPVVIERSENRVDLIFEITEGDLTTVTDIDFEGNEAYSDSSLRGVISTSESGILSFLTSSDIYAPDRLELDKELLRQFYLERGYADFEVLSATSGLTPDRDGFQITFTVREGPVYDFGDMSIDVAAQGLEPSDFAGAIPDLSGDTYDATRVDEIASELTEIAGEKGFAFIEIRPRPRKHAAERVIDITFEVGEGPRVFVERIEIEGNTQTLDRVIRRRIGLAEGDPFNVRKIREAERRIRGLNYFSRVEITPVEGSSPDRAILKVRVEEKSTGALSFGIGYSSSVGPIGNIALTERNFLGRGQYVDFRITAAGDQQIYNFAFTEPAFLGRDLAVGFRAFYLDHDLSDEASLEMRRAGLGPTVSFPLAEDLRLGLRYQFRHDDIDVDWDASPVLQQDEGSRITSSVGYTLTYDGRNDPISPTSGFLLRAGNDFAGLGGAARYVSMDTSAKGWTAFFDDQVVASLEVEVNAVYAWDNDIRINERYFLGGSSLRGFAPQGMGPRDTATDDVLGGNYSAVSRLEVSFPIGLPDELGIYGGFFVDAGTLFGLDGNPIGADGRSIDDSPHLRVGAGALLFLSTPFGPLEMSFGLPVVDESYDDHEFFRLSIGTRF